MRLGEGGGDRPRRSRCMLESLDFVSNVGPYTAVILLTVETRFLDDIFGDSGGIRNER